MCSVPPTQTAIARLFVERRRQDRRQITDRCANLEIDLYHRKRRKAVDRRATDRPLIEDIAAFYAKQLTASPQH